MQVLKKLPALRFLVLDERSYIGRKLDCSGADSFPKLQFMHIHGLENVEELIGGEEPGMQKLEDFKLVDCPKLSTISDRFQLFVENDNS